jgi:hypothetical protein
MRIDFARPSLDFDGPCLDFGWLCQGYGLVMEGEYQGIAAAMAYREWSPQPLPQGLGARPADGTGGFVGLEGNGVFRVQLFEREGGGDEGGQKWSACVRLGPHIFRKIKKSGFADEGCGIPKQNSGENGGSGVGWFALARVGSDWLALGRVSTRNQAEERRFDAGARRTAREGARALPNQGSIRLFCGGGFQNCGLRAAGQELRIAGNRLMVH